MTDEPYRPPLTPASITDVLLEGPSGVMAAPMIYTDWLGARESRAGSSI